MAPVQELDDNTSCSVGASKRFECQVIGLPRPAVRWYKDGVNITTNARYKFEYSTDGSVVLVLENVSARDQGVYSCRAHNSEGSAETVAQLYIKGIMSTADEDTTSVHTMPSFRKVDDDEEMTTQSQRRPLMIGNAKGANSEIAEELQRDNEEVVDIKDDVSNVNMLAELEDCERKEKGTLETELLDGKEVSGSIAENCNEVQHTSSEPGEEQKDELANMVDDLLELSTFENSGRRLTTDSGITSRGSSFSSEPDINITDESIQEMKEYLHGKTDALYQPYELGKMKEIKESDVEIVVVKGEKLVTTNEKAEHSKTPIVSMVSLEKEQLDVDRVNELDARVLAGMYLFDTGPSKQAEEYRHSIPALEILLRKEALDNLADDEMSKHQLEEIRKDYSVLETKKTVSGVEYQTAELINEYHLDENEAVEKLNAINIEKSSEAVLELVETKFVTVNDARYIEDDDGEDAHGEVINTCLRVSNKDENDSAKKDSQVTDKSAEAIKLDIHNHNDLENKQKTTDDSDRDNKNINYDADTSTDLTEKNDNDGELRYSTDVDKEHREKNDLALNGDVHMEKSHSKDNIVIADMIETKVTTADTQEKGDLENHANEAEVDNDSNGKTYGMDQVDSNDDAEDQKQATNTDVTSDPNIKTEEQIKDRHLEYTKAYKLETDSKISQSFEDVMTNVIDARSCDNNIFENDVNEQTKCVQNIELLGNLQADEYLTPQEVSTENTNNYECNNEYPAKNKPNSEEEDKGYDVEETTTGICKETERLMIDKDSETNLITKIELSEEEECTENGKEMKMDSSVDTSEFEHDVAYDSTPSNNTDISKVSADNGENVIKSTRDNTLAGFNTSVNIDSNTSDKTGEILTINDASCSTEVGMYEDERLVDLCYEGREIESHKTEIREIEDINVSNDIKQLEAVKDRNIETHANERFKKVDEVVLPIEKNVRNQLADLQKANVEILDKSQNILSLCSANENSDAGREFSKPIDDDTSSLVKMDDTKPEVPNIINIQNSLKQNELKTEDPSHTNELERKAMSLRDISDGAHNIVNAKEINESDGVIIHSIGVMVAPSEDIVVHKQPLVSTTPFDMKEGVAGRNEMKGENRGCDVDDSDIKEAKELERKEFTAEVDEEVFERMLTSEKAKSEHSVPDMSKFEQMEKKNSLEQQSQKQYLPDEPIEDAIVPVLMRNVEKLPDLKDMDELEKKMSEEQPAKLSINVADERNENSEDLKTVTDPPTRDKSEAINIDVSDTDSRDELEPEVIVLLEDSTVHASEGQTIELRWEIIGTSLSSTNIYKDGHRVNVDERCHVNSLDDICILTIAGTTAADEATYSVRILDSVIDRGEVQVKVSLAEKQESTTPEKPCFIIEPVVDVRDGRRLSIKCSVSGFPAPEVTWYHRGQQLDQDAFWEIYSKDGYYHLGLGDPSMIDGEQIVCRVENEMGFVQRVVAMKKEGNEVYCEPVLPPVSPEPSELTEMAPSIEIEISEIVTANLRKLPMVEDYTDRINFVSLKVGDVIEILACDVEGSVLVRNVPKGNKVCYVPNQSLAVDDVSSQVCEITRNAENKKTVTETQLYHNTEEAAMPERHKMKSPSPKMTSTPKVKRKEMDTESTEELQKRLGFSDNLASRKEFSTPDSVEFTEYNDGTTRPMFKKRLKSVTAKSGEMTQLECTVSGSPLPKILWLKNNRPLKASDGCKVIVDEGINILVFPQAKEEDVGIYTARAMNVNGSIMCSAEFTLSDGRGLPVQPITDSPMDMDFTTPAYFFQMSSCEVAEGRLARFDCRVVAYPKPDIVWMRDGKVVEAEHRFKLLNFNNEIYSLLIQNVRIEDTGRYTCWARNKFGEAMTEAYLNVISLTEQDLEGDLAPKFLTKFYDQQTTEGTSTDFKCLIAGRPEPSVAWLLDDLEIQEAQGMRVRRMDGMLSLEIKSPKVDQSGMYTCQLSNKLGEATCSAKLTVIEDKLHGKMLPKFLKKFDHVTAKEGEEAKFTSVIVGEPRPDVVWLFDHKPISDTNRRFVMKREGDAYTLIIKNVRFEDGGKITCKAANEEGEVYCSANLHVRESKYIRDPTDKTGMKSHDEIDAKFGYVPTFTKRLQDMEVKEGSRATFECRIMGIPDPDISWMKDGRVITPSGRYRVTLEGGTGQLVIDNVTAADTGVYTCIISNSQGKSSSTAALKLEELKKERYTPDRLLDERTTRKEKYTPDKYLLDDSTAVKRPYLDSDRYDVLAFLPARIKNTYDSSLSSTKLEDSYVTRPKRQYEIAKYEIPKYESPKYESSKYESPKYDSPKYESPNYDSAKYESPKSLYESPTRPYESYKPKYEPRYESPKRSYDSAYARYESPVRQYDTSYRYESPVRQYDTSYRYESPVRQYDTSYTRYESPVRHYDTSYTRYESPVRQYDTSYTRYESPVRQYDTSKALYEIPRRKTTIAIEEKIKAVPKMPFDRPAILNKHDDFVRLSWLPAPTYDLPDEARHVSYVIESREIPNREWTKVAASVPGTSHTVRNLRPDKEYEFRVRAQNQHGISEPTWNVTLDKRVDETSKSLDLPEMRAPPRLPTHRPIITDLGEETLRLAWRPVETYQAKRMPPVSYRLEAKELPGKDWMPLSTRLRDTTHYLSELPHDRDYMIRVRAENDFGVSEPTEALWLPRAKAFPGVPVARPEIIDYEDTRAKLSWSRVDIPTFGLNDTPLMYMLEVEEPPSRDWRTIARDLDDTVYIVEGLRPGQDYRFRVRAKTPTGIVSEPSPAVSLYTKLAQSRAPVDRLQVVEYEPDTSSVNLSWDRVYIPPYNVDEEPLMYMLEYQEPPLPEWRTLVTGVPTTRYRVMNLDADRDYKFRVRALTSYGVSPPSPALPVTLKQLPVTRALPEAVVISEVESNSLRLSWRRPMYDIDRPVSYQVEMLEGPFSDWKPIATRVLETTYKVTGLKPTKDYQFRVIPQVDSGYLEPTPSAALTTMPVKPRLPYTEPKLRELNPESVQLSWGSAELPAYQRKRSPIYYKVEMSELPTTNWVPVARKVADTTYNVTGLRPNQEYKFRIFAESDSGLSEPSMPAVLYRKPAPRFSSKEPVIRDVTQNIVHLAWTPAEVPDSASPVSYMVEMQTPPGIAAWSTLYAKHPSPSVRLADLRPDLDYLVRVRAQSGTYTSEPTMSVYIPRRAAPPKLSTEQPYAIDINSDYVKLQWRSAELPTHIQDYAPVTYRLEAQELPDTNWVSISRGIPHTDFKVTGLNPQRDYNFRVRAENDYGLSNPTHSLAIRKRSVAPILPSTEPMLYDIGPGSARLTWRPATLPSFANSQSPITYTLFVQEHPLKTWRPLVKGIPHTTYYVTGLLPDKEYMFRVQAENQFGSSKPTEGVCLPKYSDYTRPISIPEISDFDEDLTSVKLRWKPTGATPPFDRTPSKYTVESWEPVRREWKPVARGVPDTSYHIRGLPKLPDHLFRVRMESDQPALSEPSLPVSLSRYSLPMAPIFRPQLYELDEDTVRLSWQPVQVPEGVSRRSVRYIIEQREIPDTRWSPIATDVTETSYKIRGLRSKCDYEFRVKAMFDGTYTEPSFPVSLFRRSVIPKVKFDAPEVYNIDDTSLSLRWNTVDVPAFTHDEEPLLFIIERQTLPSYEWQPVATNVPEKTYTVRDLQPYQDYNFRVRGVYPSGYTDPSPYVPVYRRPIRHSVPVARTEVWEEEPSSARLRWHRAYIPHYYSSTPLRYRVEMQEAGGIETEWRSVATDITTPDFTVKDISPKKDYRFRIRAQMENGDISEPTPPIQYYRTRVPMMRDRENALADFKPVEYKAIFLNHPYYDQLTKYVPPSMPINKPDLIPIDTETIELSWRPAIVAEAIKGICNLTYTIEVRCPPSFEWRQLVTGLKTCSHTAHKLHPRIDYVFRVRAWNEYGSSEAGLPVSLYRPQVFKREDEEDDEDFEREWELKYGTKVPPKLPIDTPRIVTQSSESVWFTWLSARLPAYAKQTNINYVVEIKEPPSTAWQRDVTGLVDCQYVKEGLNPNQEYHIRVRAETEFGASDPTMSIILRGKGSRPGSRRSSVDREDLTDKIDLSYLENVVSGVPPRMASTRPLSSSVGPDCLTLSWSPCRTPSYVKASNITYIIEKREPPGNIWTTLVKDIKSFRYDITGLNPDQDYMFRVRAKNDFGLSDPTLPMTLYRDRDDYVPQRIRSRSSSRDSISMLVSKVMRRSSSTDYGSMRMEDDRSSEERIPCQPQYFTTYDIQYGAIGKKGKITLEVRGYPLPTVHWYLGEEKIDYGGRFNAFVTPAGSITLEIKNVGLDTIGQYKCYAENASGAAVKLVTFELAEPPTVLETIKDQSAIKGDSISLKCRVDGFPTPTIKWVKDWRPLADCTRVKMVNLPPETYTLEICSLLEDDEGLYACTVENIAGKVTVVGRLKVEIDSIPEFEEVNIRSTPIEERYHVLEEIGRGRHGVVRRVVEVSTGRTFAANFMSMRNKAQKSFFLYEYEVLRSLWQTGAVLKLYDAFETDRSLIFVTEILTEPELLEKVTSDGNWTEVKVAAIIRKLLAILQELSLFKILHLDIKPSNIRMAGTGLDDIKLIGFGMSRILQPEEEITHNYGSVGYASPEQVTNEVLTSTSDLFSVGVLAYILLSGNGPFQGSSEIEILNLMSECNWSFEGRGFEKFSKEGLDFISRLLVKDSSKRMSVEECINHTWMSTESAAKMNTEQLKQFYNAEKLQRETEKVFTSVQLQSFAKIIHGAKALYQPAVDIESGEIIFPDSDEYGDYLDEDAWYEWQLQYLDDPDSQIYPVQDKNFTVRECRHAGAPKWTSPKEVERSDKDILDSGTGLMFRDKIQPTTFLVGEDVTFTATVVSETGEIPVVTWYRDEQLLSDDYRADAEFNFETGFAKLTVVKSKDYDAAVYKCVARVKDGRVSCEARLLLGDKPSKSGRPYVTQASGTEAFLTWTGPASDGNAYLLGYRIDYRKEGDKKWTQGPYVTEEYALLTGLEPDSTYIFRVSGHNKYGASPFSWSSLETKTLGNDAPKVSVAVDLQPLMQFSTFDKQQLILPTESRRPSLTIEEEAKINESDPNEKFSFADTISKGSFGEYKLCTNKTSNRQCVAKIMSYNKDNQSTITAEFELLCTLRQTNLVIVLDSYLSGDQFYVIYEFLSGINIVQYLCLHKAYKEETVARIVRQVLDALQYLEHYGIIHLNLQPSSIVMATRRRPHVKLRDFTMAHKIEGDKGVKVPLAGFPDFTAPEVIKGDNVTFTADIWTLGALTFTMLSGISAFGGKSLEETLSRILFDRYSTKEMYDNVSKESVKFVIKLMSRLPRNRPTVTKCINSHWLNLSESMVNARNSKMFKSEKLRAFSVDYLAKRGNIDYNLAFVDIEKLPKITSGPLIRPILSDRITNRLEYLLRTRIQTADLTESLKTEAANLPKQPLIEKIVSKIERDTKVDEKNIIEMKEEMANKDLVKMTEDNEVNEKVVEDIKVQESEIKEKVLEPKLTDTERIEVLEEINANNIEIKKLVEEIQVKDIAINKTVEEKANEETKIKEKLEEMKVKDSEIIKMEQGEIKEKMENIKTKDSEINTKEIGIVEVEKSKIKEKLEEKNSKDIESNKAMEEITNVEEIEVKKHVEETEVRDTEINEKEEDISNGKDSEFMDSATNVTDTNVDKVEDITAKETGIIKKLEEETTRIDESEIKEIVENKNVTDTEVQEKTEKQYVKCTEIKENTEEPKVKLEESVVKISEKPEEKDNNVEITEKEKHKMPTDTEIMVINQVKDTQVNENVEEMKVTGIEVKDKIDNTMAKDTETKETTGDNSVKDDTIKEVVDGTRNTEIKTAVEETKHEDRVVDNADTNGIPAEIVEDKGEIQHIEEEEVFEDALETLGVEDAKSVETDVSNVTKTVGENANEVNNEKIEQPTSTQTEIVKNDNAVEVVEEKAEESKKDISEAISNENIDKAGEAVKAVGELAEQKAEEIEKADLDEIATAVRQSEEGKGSDAQTNTTKEQSPSTIAENITTPISKSSKEEPVQEKEENADQSIIDKTEKAESVTDGLAVDEQSKSVEDEAKAIPHMKEIADSKCEEVTEHSEMIKEQVEETETLDIFNKQAEAISIETESVNKSESAESIDKSEQTESIERSEQNESVEKSEQTASVKMSEKPESIEQSKIFGENNAKEPDVETKKSETVLEETRTGTESKATSEKEKEEVKVTANEILSEQQLTCEDSKTTEMKVEKDSVKPAESKEVSLKEAESEKLSANKETVSMINVEEKVASVSEKLVDNVVMSVAETDTAEAVTSEHVMEKHQSISASIKEESVSEVVKQVEGTEIHETATAEKHVAASKFIPTPGDDETSMLKEEISVSVSEQADGTSVKKVSVTQKHETLITDGDVSKSTDMAITSTLLQEENIEGSSSTFVASSETSTMISEKREETLVSGNAVSTISETTEPVSSSATEDSVVEPAIASNLETAKVTESRETVREFVTNDSEIEQMKKELLEDMGVTSAECGKFLMGSHEDISAIIEKIEIKPDEEEIEKVATNRFIDDALMFC